MMKFRSSFLMFFAFCLTLMAFTEADAQTRRNRRARVNPVNQQESRMSVPVGTELTVRLRDTIDTKDSRDGDRFSATVVSPSTYANAVVEGHISRIAQSGKLKGKTALSLQFDRIVFQNGASDPMDAQVVRVIDEEGSTKKVDEEGNVESGDRGKTTAIRTGGGAAAGAVIGAIAGGGKGAAIGAIIGAGVGAGSTFIQGSSKVKLEPGTELLIRTTR